MKAIFLAALVGSASVSATASAAAAAASKPYTLLGCYSDEADSVLRNSSVWQTAGVCYETCVLFPKNAGNATSAIMAITKGTDCYCGNKLPNTAYKVDDAKCGVVCPGFKDEACGGAGRYGMTWSVYNTNEEPDIEMEPAPKSSTSASKTNGSTSSDPNSTATTTSEPTTAAPSKGVNKAGVAAGAVVGVLAIIALGVGAFIFMRKRRRQEVEEEYRRSVAVRGFVQKPALDNRLDPVMVQRRDSVGSIADNQDYSRKILRVTNPDG